MGVRIGSTFSTAFIGPLPASAAETLCFTTGPLGLAVDNAAVLIFWSFSYTAGTTNSAAQFRIRRGTLVTSTNIFLGQWTAPAVAAAASFYSGVYVDQPGVTTGLQYSLTIVQTAATGAGTFNDGCLMAMVL